MKITKRQLKRIIKEELGKIKESDPYGDPPRPGEQGSADEEPRDIIDGDTGEIYADWEKPEWNDEQFSGMEADFEIWLSNSKNKDFVRHPDSEALTKEHGPAWWVHNEYEEARAAKRAKRLSAPLVGKYNLPADGWGIPEGKNKESTMKIKKSQLRRIIKEELEGLSESMSYGDAMTQVDQIMTDIRNAGEINWDLSNRLLSIVGNDGSWETDEARSAIHSIEDEGLDALYDAENYIRDALRSQGR